MRIPFSLQSLSGIAACMVTLGAPAAAQAALEGHSWVTDRAALRTGYEEVKLPEGGRMGLVGATYLVEAQPGLCVGPAAYGSISGPYGGLFTFGVDAAFCPRLAGPLSLEAGVYVGGGGGGGAKEGGGLMVRPYVNLLYDLGGWRAGTSVSYVTFPSGEIRGTQLGLVFELDTSFTYLPGGRDWVALTGSGHTGAGIDRVLATVGAYRPDAGTLGADDKRDIQTSIGTVGGRLDHFLTPNLYAGFETNAAASGGAAGYAELLATLGAEWPLAGDRFTVGGRVALGMGGGGNLPTGGGLLGKAALDASIRLSRDLSVGLEGGWARAPQGSFSAPYGSVSLRWDLDHADGAPAALARQEWIAGVETYTSAARLKGPDRSVQNIVLAVNRFVGESVYLSAQVHSAYDGDCGAFSVGLFGLGAQTRFGEAFTAGAEMLVGAAGGGAVDTGNGAIAQPRVYVGVDLSRSISLRLGAGRVKSFDGDLDSNFVDLNVAFSFGVASRP